MIDKNLINKKISSIKKYFILIDEDIFIDYFCFFFEEGNVISITIDSSAENIMIMNFAEMNEAIKRTDIKYIIEEIEKDIFLKDIYYEFDEYHQLQKIDFIFDEKRLEISIGLDSVLYKIF